MENAAWPVVKGWVWQRNDVFRVDEWFSGILPPIPPSIRVFSNESALHIKELGDLSLNSDALHDLGSVARFGKQEHRTSS